MDKGANLLQRGLPDIEYVAEQVLITRQDIAECDRARNSNREALTALRRQARTSRTSVPRPALIVEVGEQTTADKCLTCGDDDGDSRLWVMCGSTDVFLRLPFHATHSLLEKEEDQLGHRSRSLQSTMKEKTMSLSEKGGLSDRIPTSLLNAFVNLKANNS